MLQIKPDHSLYKWGNWSQEKLKSWARVVYLKSLMADKELEKGSPSSPGPQLFHDKDELLCSPCLSIGFLSLFA